MSKKLRLIALSSLILSFNVFAKPVIELYKSPTCGCCKEWAAIMEKKGYEVNVNHARDWSYV
ncbi:CopG family transcriptional regulator, partial [Vibrio sp. 2-2(9)]|nr:CopG family transcriptional regulator [Vibrio sp. 2-2(9)]